MLLHRWYQSPAAFCGPPVPAGGPPVNTFVPSIADLTPTEGETLTCTPGTWAGTAPIVLGYQWFKFTPGDPTDPPVNTAPPSIADDHPVEGETLTCVPGTWSGTAPIVLSHQWFKEDVVVVSEGRLLTDESSVLTDDFGNPLTTAEVVAAGSLHRARALRIKAFNQRYSNARHPRR